MVEKAAKHLMTVSHPNYVFLANQALKVSSIAVSGRKEDMELALEILTHIRTIEGTLISYDIAPLEKELGRNLTKSLHLSAGSDAIRNTIMNGIKISVEEEDKTTTR